MESSLKQISETVRAQRSLRRLSQVELAELAGVTFRPVHQIENGRPIRLDTLLRICAVLGLDVSLVPKPPTPRT